MKSKIAFIFFFGFCLFASCASLYPMLPFNKRIYHPCEDDETIDPVGKLCFSRCSKRANFSGKCEEWETIIEDFNSQKFYEFRAAGFKMIVVK